MRNDATMGSTPASPARFRLRLAMIAVVVALVVISAFSPGDASAMPRSQRQIGQLCKSAGGRAQYEFGEDANSGEMICTLQSGASFVCLLYGTYGWFCY